MPLIKVLMIIKELRYSGAYKMFMWVATALADRGLDVVVVTYKPNDVSQLSSKIKWLKYDWKDNNIFVRYRKLRKIVKEIDPDCSISFLLDANVLNTLACLGFRAKSIICERNDPFKPRYYKLKIAKCIFRFVDGAVFQLNRVRDYYSMIKKETAVIPNPVFGHKTAKIQPFHERDNVIVTLGRIDVKQKRHDLLIKAFSLFHEKYPDFRLHIFGDGPDKDVAYIKSLIIRLNLQNAIKLMGITNKPKEEIRTAKFFVLSSDFEGIPNALIEAMSVGLPCISTDCRPGGAALLIKTGVNGIIVPAHHINALFEAMIYLVENPDFSNKIGDEALNIEYEFSQEKITDLWIEYLEKVCP